MFEKRRIDSDLWERITAGEALGILNGVTYQTVYALRVRLYMDGEKIGPAISESPDLVGTLAGMFFGMDEDYSPAIRS